MKKILLSSSVIGLLCITSPALASGGAPAPTVPGVVTGPYLGVAAGYGGLTTSGLDESKRSTARISKKQERGFSWRLFAGYLWNIAKIRNLKLGIEIGYASYPENSYLVNSLKWSYNGYNFDLLGVGKYYFHNFNLIAKAGIAYVSQVYKAEIPGVLDISKTKTAVLPKIAFGFGYDVTSNIGIDVLFDHVFAPQPKETMIITAPPTNSDFPRVKPVNTIQVSVHYHFAIERS